MKADPLTLSSIGDRLETWSRNPLHPTLLPFGALALVHALRVSHATRQVAGSHRNQLGLWQSFLLNQILMFAGVIVSGMLLGIPSPLLTAWPVVVLYGGMHIVADITPAGKMLLDLQEHETVGILMDLSFALLDGILRAEGIIDLGIEAVRTHPSPQLSTSTFAALVNAAIIGGGVPLLIDLFRLDSPTGEWGIRAPTWARDPFSGTNDIFSSTFLGIAYLALSSPAPAQVPIIGRVARSFGVDALSNRDVRTFCSLLLGSILLAEKAVVLSGQSKPISKAPTTIKNCSAKTRQLASRKQQ